MSNTLTITAELAHEIIREKYNLPDNFNVVIVQPMTVEVKQSDDGWIDVPSNWFHNVAPPEAQIFDYIEVEYDGIDDSDFGKPIDWNFSWNREIWNHIVRFRRANKYD